jgi:peptidoglycan-N-acetylglucosamine deacetylase
VVSQRLIGGRWVDRDAANVGADGRFQITIRPSEVARYHLRVRSAQGSVRSPAMRMTTYTDRVSSVYDTGSARPGERVVALTFDDGPHPRATPRVLDVLARHGVKGTFFVVGRNAATWPDPVRRAVREGHRIANHSWSHPTLTTLGDAAVRSELQRTQDQIARLGSSSICVRPPYGAQNTRVRNLIVSQVRSSTILWNVDPGDWRGLSASGIVSTTMAQVRPGSIILLHDSGRSSTIEALDRLIPALKRAGYGFRLIC